MLDLDYFTFQENTKLGRLSPSRLDPHSVSVRAVGGSGLLFWSVCSYMFGATNSRRPAAAAAAVAAATKGKTECY